MGKSDSDHPDLSRVDQALAAGDAAALQALQAHADRGVSKAARKAIHMLRTRGVSVEAAPPRGWKAASTADLRGEVAPDFAHCAFERGALLVTISRRDAEEGGAVLFAMIGEDGGIGHAEHGMQSDGQRARMFRAVRREDGERTVPLSWALARVRAAQALTRARAQAQHPAVDAAEPMLAELEREHGASVKELPWQGVTPTPLSPPEVASPVNARLFAPFAISQSAVGALMTKLVAGQEDGDEERAPAEGNDEAAEQARQAKRSAQREIMLRAISEIDEVRDALRVDTVVRLRDEAMLRWLRGDAPGAAALSGIADELAAAEDPTAHPVGAALAELRATLNFVRVAQSQGLLSDSNRPDA